MGDVVDTGVSATAGEALFKLFHSYYLHKKLKTDAEDSLIMQQILQNMGIVMILLCT